MKTILLTLSILSLGLSAYAEDPVKKALDIATKAEQFNNGFKGEKSKMKMILINAYNDRVEREMLSKTMETPKDGDKSVVEFVSPADVKGTKMLTHTHKTTDDDQWLFLPALKRTKRISSRNKTGSFMGSEFSYEDLGSQEVEKYTYKYTKEGKLDGRAVHIYERVPTDKKSGYSKQIVWLDKEYQQPLKIEYYDRKGELLKTATFKNYTKFKKWWRQETIEMVNHQTKKSSILNWSDRVLEVSYNDQDFNKKKLKN